LNSKRSCVSENEEIRLYLPESANYPREQKHPAKNALNGSLVPTASM